MPNKLADKILTMYNIDTNLDTLHEGKIADGIKKIGTGIALGTMIFLGGVSAQQDGVSQATKAHAIEIRKEADEYRGAAKRAEQGIISDIRYGDYKDLDRLELTHRNMTDKTKELDKKADRKQEESDKAKNISRSSAGISGASGAALALSAALEARKKKKMANDSLEKFLRKK